MYPKKDRVISLLENAIDEMDLLGKMSAEILSPDDFVTTISGITAFRACGMSLQYIKPYSAIPWDAVFGMRNFLSHEYGEVDAEGVFNTVKVNIPELLPVTRQILSDVQSGRLAIGD